MPLSAASESAGATQSSPAATVGVQIAGIAPACFSLSYLLVFLCLAIYAAVEELTPGYARALVTDETSASSPAVHVGPAAAYANVIFCSAAWGCLYMSFLQAQAASVFYVHQQLRDLRKNGFLPAPREGPSLGFSTMMGTHKECV